MDTCKLDFDFSHLQMSRSCSVTGSIWWRFADKTFPEAGWNDFPIVILEWWGSSILRLLNRISDQETLSFMDGPFALRLQIQGTDMVKVSSLQLRKQSTHTSDEGMHQLSRLASEISRAGHDALSWMPVEGAENPDSLRLQATLSSLDTEIGTKK